MIYGIPNFKLEKQIVLRRHQLMKDGGIEFHLGVDIGGEISLEDLQKKHDAVLIATGVYKSRIMEVPNASLENIIPALSYLTASNRKNLGDKVPQFDSGEFNAAGKTVVVVGGGDTAMDCVRTAVRQGAKSVTCLYRRDRANMPGSAREVKNAEEEGVHFMWLAAPKAFVGDKKVERILIQRMRLITQDASGRQNIQPVEGETFAMDADMVIQALGFEAEDIPVMFGAPALKLSRNGTIEINQHNFMSSIEGVFAAGDIVRGASLVVWAIRDGRDAAKSIHNYISTKSTSKNPQLVRNVA